MSEWLTIEAPVRRQPPVAAKPTPMPVRVEKVRASPTAVPLDPKNPYSQGWEQPVWKDGKIVEWKPVPDEAVKR